MKNEHENNEDENLVGLGCLRVSRQNIAIAQHLCHMLAQDDSYNMATQMSLMTTAEELGVIAKNLKQKSEDTEEGSSCAVIEDSDMRELASEQSLEITTNDHGIEWIEWNDVLRLVQAAVLTLLDNKGTE